MKKLLFITGLIFTLFACKTESKPAKTVEVKTDAPEIALETYDYKKLEPILNLKNDKTYVINFWATWCKPCVEELPAFEKLNTTYKEKNVEVILVSLDFPKQVEKRLKPFIKKKNLQSKVILLDDVNEDIWIKQIDEKWSGAIPATLIYNKDKRVFYEESFDYKKLQNEVDTFLN